MKKTALFISFCFLVFISNAQRSKITSAAIKDDVVKGIDAKYDSYKKIALQIWEYAEVGYKEQKSSALLQQTLQSSGFTVEAGVAGIPTAFVATYGSGKPVIAILAEFDALPGLSQQAIPEKKAVAGKDAGMVAVIICLAQLPLQQVLK